MNKDRLMIRAFEKEHKGNVQHGHNVGYPPLERYHLPEVGGHYAPRVVRGVFTDSKQFLCWYGYDPDTMKDHIYVSEWSHGKRVETTRLTPSSGIYQFPVMTIDPSGDSRHVFWIEDGMRITSKLFNDDRWEPIQSVFEGEGWLRDLSVCMDPQGTIWCVWICSKRSDDGTRVQSSDELMLASLKGNSIQLHKSLQLNGFVSRLDLVVEPEGLAIAYDTYIDGQYEVGVRKLQEEKWAEPCFTTHGSEDSSQFPKLIVDAWGKLWICYLSERIVEKDGVIGRLSGVRIAAQCGSSWVHSPGADESDYAVYLHQGILPDNTYFGYSGNRRRPMLTAATDGSVYLVWEVQPDEGENWHVLWNGQLHAMRFDSPGKSGSAPRIWQEGGGCFYVDGRSLQAPERICCARKAGHREQGDDYELFFADHDRSPFVEIPPNRSGWLPYLHPEKSSTRPWIEQGGRRYQLFFGDFHNHSTFSPDAEGEPDELYHFARDQANLDFVGITDNDFYPEKVLHASELDYQIRLAEHLREEGHFLSFSGFEWTFHKNDPKETSNHRSIVFLPGERRIIRRIEQQGSNESVFRNSLKDMDVFAHAHHGEFELFDLQQEANVEVTSGWVINMEKSKTIHCMLDQGHRFGFIGGSDGHRAIPGLGGALVAVWAEALTVEAIVDALKHRRCYATTGNRTTIDFRLDGQIMGEVVHLDRLRRLSVRVEADYPLKQVTIVRNGEVAHDFACRGQCQLEAEWEDQLYQGKRAWYYVRVEDERPFKTYPHNICQHAGPYAWSSPIWAE